MTISVMNAFSNMLFSEGIARLLDDEKDVIVSCLDLSKCEPNKEVQKSKPDVILVDFTSLYNNFNKECINKFILLDTQCGEENIMAAVLSKGVKGVLQGNTTTSLLKKAIRSVVCGEVWFDKATVKNLISGFNAKKENKVSNLSTREREIIVQVTKGYTNKEIANNLFVSEPTVKSHMYNIFRKIDISNRPQLIAFAYNNSDMLGLPDSESNDRGYPNPNSKRQ